MEMLTIISKQKRKCGNILVCFHKLSPFIAFQILPISACIWLFNISRPGTEVENTFAFRCPHKKKSHGVWSRLEGGLKSTAHRAIRRSSNFCFQHWIAEWVACGVVPSCWNQVCFRTILHPFNPKKMFHPFILGGINTNCASVFVLKKRGPVMWYCEMVHHAVTHLECSDYQLTSSSCFVCLHDHSIRNVPCC